MFTIYNTVFTAHIFFDDAMELSDDDRLVPNSFVSDFIDCIDDALRLVLLNVIIPVYCFTLRTSSWRQY